MIVTLLYEEIIVFLDQHFLTMNHSSLDYLLQKLVVELRPFINQSQLSDITMLHAIIKYSLHQKNDHKPIN